MWNHLFTLAACATIALCVLTRIPTFHRAYTEHQQRLDDDEWLRAQCADPHFFSNMRRHTSVCDDARAAFTRPPWLVGVQACLPTRVLPELSWEGVVMVALLLILAPGVLLPVLRARTERMEHIRMLDACSPMLRIRHRLEEGRPLLAVSHI
jgi:hypothetical protein